MRSAVSCSEMIQRSILLGDDRNGGKAAFRHAFQRTADRVGIVNIDHFGLWLEKKGYVHMRYLTAARSRPFM